VVKSASGERRPRSLVFRHADIRNEEAIYDMLRE
jgi:hypothetical protein